MIVASFSQSRDHVMHNSAILLFNNLLSFPFQISSQKCETIKPGRNLFSFVCCVRGQGPRTELERSRPAERMRDTVPTPFAMKSWIIHTRHYYRRPSELVNRLVPRLPHIRFDGTAPSEIHRITTSGFLGCFSCPSFPAFAAVALSHCVFPEVSR